MKTKIAFIVCATAMLLNTGCSSTKSTEKTRSSTTGNDKTTSSAPAQNSSNNAISDNNPQLPPVAEAPRRQTWGSNISPYFN